MASIDIVIVNWNSGAQLLDCVSSVIAARADGLNRIVVVDNASIDGSACAVEEFANVEVLYSGENLGFAAACNLGAQATTADYLLFLNPDTRVDAESLTVPLVFMEREANLGVGICGIQLLNDRGGVSRSCARFPTLVRLVVSALGLNKLPGLRALGMRMSEWTHDQTREVDQVMGAFFFVRSGLFRRLGQFDDRFFVYFEEVDFSLRARKAGWTSVFLSEAQAFHAGGGTSGQVKAHRLFYSLRSRLLFGFKHFPRWQAWVLVGVTGLVEPVSRIIWCLGRGGVGDLRDIIRAYIMLWRGMARITRGEGRFDP